jgi:lysophospholipase L1-like esterase
MAADPQPPGKGMLEQPCPPQAGLSFASPYVKQNDWPWLCRYQAANAELAKAAPPKVVFMGDSITEGWIRLDPGLFASGTVGRGISGQTSPQMLLRFRQDVISLRPRIVHIMAGTNDVAGNSGPTSAEAFKDNIRAMVDIAGANGIAVILGSIPPAARFNWAPELQPGPQIAALNSWLKDFAHEKGAVYADYHTALGEADGALRQAFSADGVHPNAAGYAAMRPIADQAIKQAERKLRWRRR